MREALTAGIVWAAISLILDALLLGAVFKIVTVPFLLTEVQTWTRALALVAGALLGIRRKS